ncbi:MAG: hypothetical protein MZV64_02645 [Ignavibacteriales bacterium]|nr:hypothetical protein [Ignavibacteriales bacterium]
MRTGSPSPGDGPHGRPRPGSPRSGGRWKAERNTSFLFTAVPAAPPDRARDSLPRPGRKRSRSSVKCCPWKPGSASGKAATIYRSRPGAGTITDPASGEAMITHRKCMVPVRQPWDLFRRGFPDEIRRIRIRGRPQRFREKHVAASDPHGYPSGPRKRYSHGHLRAGPSGRGTSPFSGVKSAWCFRITSCLKTGTCSTTWLSRYGPRVFRQGKSRSMTLQVLTEVRISHKRYSHDPRAFRRRAAARLHRARPGQ